MVLLPAVKVSAVLLAALAASAAAAQDCSESGNGILWERTKSCQDEVRVSCGAIPSVLEDPGDAACCRGASLTWRCGSENELEFECADEASELMLAERLETGVRFRCLAPMETAPASDDETEAEEDGEEAADPS